MYGLRLINNNKPSSLDGREWNIYGDEGFKHGKASHCINPEGSAPIEVRQGLAARRSEAAGAAGVAASRGRATSGTGRRAPKPQVVRRWMDAAASASTWIPACSHADLFAPALERVPTFPVARLHWHSEPFPRAARLLPQNLTRELPEDFLRPVAESLPIDKHAYYSIPAVGDELRRREERRTQESQSVGLKARDTWRVKAGSTYMAMPQREMAKSASAPGLS
mmetsp:Transcript_42426/g.112297  ORF Transcript_42426/g.112297 Transcript_42426/m.112297 type:complete len:223 (-) Transcript_42426:80-748(-)